MTDIKLQIRASGPPYPPGGAILGGTPDGKTDVAISAVFVVIFASLAATHMTIFQVNKKRAHFFVPSAVTFGFCMARITTFILRIGLALVIHLNINMNSYKMHSLG